MRVGADKEQSGSRMRGAQSYKVGGGGVQGTFAEKKGLDIFTFKTAGEAGSRSHENVNPNMGRQSSNLNRRVRTLPDSSFSKYSAESGSNTARRRIKVLANKLKLSEVTPGEF